MLLLEFVITLLQISQILTTIKTHLNENDQDHCSPPSGNQASVTKPHLETRFVKMICIKVFTNQRCNYQKSDNFSLSRWRSISLGGGKNVFFGIRALLSSTSVLSIPQVHKFTLITCSEVSFLLPLSRLP